MLLKLGQLGFRSSSNPAFSPTEISNLALWLDAADTSTITDTSGSVSQWDDKSGNNNHAVQGTASQQPITGTRTINNNNGIYFDGANDVLSIAGTGLDTISAADNTVFIVYKSDTTDNQFRPLYSSGSQRFGFDNNQADGALGFDNGSPFNSRRISITPDTDTHILIGGNDLTSLFIYYDDTSSPLASGTLSLGNLTSPMHIGAFDGTGGLGLNGVMCEAIIYSRNLTTAEKNEVGNYLASKWGISWTNI